MGKQVLDKLFGSLAVIGILGDAHAGYQDQGSGISARQEVVAGPKTFPFFLQEPQQVVVVHEPDVHLPAGHGGNDGGVVGVVLCIVGLDSLEPIPGCILSPFQPERRNEGLERPVQGSPADPALPFRAGEPQNRLRQVLLRINRRSVINDGPDSPGHANPLTRR